MTYPALNATLVQANLMELFIYANTVTYGLFTLFLVVGFFLVTLLGGMAIQFKLSGRIKPDTSLLAASFSTLGWATILEMYSGLLNPIYFFMLIGITILSMIWVSTSD